MTKYLRTFTVLFLLVYYLETSTGTPTPFSSPNYPSAYNSMQINTWNVNTTSGHAIRFVIDVFAIHSGANCQDHYLTFYDGPSDSGTELYTYGGCEDWSPYLPLALTSTLSQASAVFTATDNFDNSIGFNGTYDAVIACGGSNDAAVPVDILSDNYPSEYDNMQTCIWTITSSNIRELITVTINDFDLEDEATCSNDNLIIYDGTTSDVVLWEGCGSLADAVVLNSTGYTVTIVFTSNSHIIAMGFNITYDVLPIEIETTTYNSAVCDPLPTWLSIEFDDVTPQAGQEITYRCIDEEGYKFDDHKSNNHDTKDSTCNEETGSWSPYFIGCSYVESAAELAEFLKPVEAKNAKVIGSVFAIVALGSIVGLMVLMDVQVVVQAIMLLRQRWRRCTRKKKKKQTNRTVSESTETLSLDEVEDDRLSIVDEKEAEFNSLHAPPPYPNGQSRGSPPRTPVIQVQEPASLGVSDV